LIRAVLPPLAALLVAAAAAPAHVLFERVTLRQWVIESNSVVLATFESDALMWEALDGSDRQEYFRVRVDETLAGPIPKGTLEFFPHAEGFPAFHAGDRALLFLEPSDPRPEFARVATRFPWFSGQGAGEEWIFEPGVAGASVREIALRLASQRERPPADPRAALRDLLLAELASGVSSLRRDALRELMQARARPDFLDAETTPLFAAWAANPEVPATQRLALVRVLDGAPGFDADARLRAMTQEPLAGMDLAQLVRTAGQRSDPALQRWLVALSNDPRPEVAREARAALAAANR
jgi:hypothetical protein